MVLNGERLVVQVGHEGCAHLFDIGADVEAKLGRDGKLYIFWAEHKMVVSGVSVDGETYSKTRSESAKEPCSMF